MQSSPTANDQNLLFGMLAFQLDFVTQKQLIETMQAWMLDKTKPLGDVFVEKGLLTPDRGKLLSSLVAEHLSQHENDPQKSLASMRLPESLRNPLQSLGDPQVSQLMSLAPNDQDQEALATMLPTARRKPDEGRRFVTVRPLDEGGLGIVSVALDTELTREVALKEIKSRFADQVDSRARFLKEAEITGRLEHPGIVPVYGLGAYSDGRPYYAMRMIIGASLKEAIKEFHTDRAEGSDEGQRNLAFRELLQRFIDVCHAMEYAHSRGIVHRDLKPANIMLGKYRETLVVDWGLAKSVGETDQQSSSDETVIIPELGGESLPTRMGEVVGTLGFMSPEQAAGRVKEAGPLADVYSLGATLYNMITGKVAFKDKDVGQLLRNVQQGKFPRPREVKRSIPRSLEAICVKSMACSPPDRYQSAQALAEDLEHYLADEPVLAYREPISLRARRWMRKHPKIVTTALTLVVGGLIVFGAFAGVLNKKNQELQLAKKRADEARYVAEGVKEFMVNAFRSPEERDGKTITVYEVLTRLSPEDIKEQVDPRLEADLNEAIGQPLVGLGLYADAVPFLETAHQLFTASYGMDHPETLATMDLLANAYSKAGQHEKAIPLLENALERTRNRYGDEHRSTLKKMNNLAFAYQQANQGDAALPLLEETFRMTRTKFGTNDEGTLASMNNLAVGYQRANRLDKAMPIAKQTLDLAREKFGEDDLRTFTATKTLAVVYQTAGRLEEALELAEATFEFRQARLGEDHPETLGAWDLLLDVLLNKQDYPEAEAVARKYLATLAQVSRKDDARMARARTALASALLGQEKADAAAAEAEQALEFFTTSDPLAIDRLRADSILGSSLAREKKWDVAERMLIDAYEQLRSRLTEIRPTIRWYAPWACERIIEAYVAKNEAPQVSKWKSELAQVNDQIERLRNAGSATSGSG